MELRKAKKEDFDFFLKIKSEPENMYWTGHENKPDETRLKEWFYKELKGETREIFIALEKDVPVGYSYTLFGEDNNGVETAVAVSTEFSGLGYGKAIVKQTTLLSAEKFPNKSIHAWILEKNIASIRIHEQAGYKKTHNNKEINGEKMYLFEYGI